MSNIPGKESKSQIAYSLESEAKAASEALKSSKEKTEYRCVRWAWTGDVYNRKVVCLEWQKVDKK